MSKSKKPFIIAVCVIVGIILVVSTVFGIYLYAFAQSEKYYGEMLGASTVDSSCKRYLYDMIKGETLSNTDKTPEPLFPEWGDDEDTRRERAYEKTVGEALKYYGYYDYADVLYKYGVTYDHDIRLMKDRNGKVFENINQDISLTENTTLGEIYQQFKECVKNAGLQFTLSAGRYPRLQNSQ